MRLSVVLITLNEEANLPPTLASVRPLVADGVGEIIVLDSGSMDRTLEIAHAHGARIFSEEWKGYSAQKNSAIDKAAGEWVLSLDADESLEPELAEEILEVLAVYQTFDHARQSGDPLESGKLQLFDGKHGEVEIGEKVNGYRIPFKHHFLGRWVKHGGFYPDRKLRLFRKGQGRFKERAVHEAVEVDGATGQLNHAIIHRGYPTLSAYIEHMNRYSTLGAEVTGKRGFSLINIVLRPWATFVYNYFFRLGFLDGREGLLLHLYHAVYVSWKYAKAWEQGRRREAGR
ncbi:MAG: glycosyltransferase family 2 protein [Terriglobales bacterium]